jgi:hypothetical protein
MTQVGIVLRQGRLIRAIETLVPTVFLDSSLNRTTCLPKADLTTLAEEALQSQLFFDGRKEADRRPTGFLFFASG